MISIFFFVLIQCLLSLATAQQPYVGMSTTDCSVTDNSTSVFGYSCNGLNRTCLTYAIFRSTPPYSTASSISSLFSVNASLLSSLNNEATTFPTDQRVIIPLTCSCSGNYSQSNLTYTIRQGDSYFFVANDTLQGLSTCQALVRQNNAPSQSLFPGMRILVPVRCACPTSKQVVEDGVNYLVSYPVVFGDTVDIISQRFGVETSKTLEANQLSFDDPGVFPFTTVLVPLQNPPSNLNSITPPPPPPTQPVSPPVSGKKHKRTWVYVLVGILGGALVLSVIGAVMFCMLKKGSREKQEPDTIDSFTAKKTSISYQESDLDPLDGLSGMVVDTLKVYKFHELQSATSDFTSSSSLGGSSGYIGKINGDGAMIKKMEGNASEEINLLSKLNHFNIIRLSGFCFHEGEWYLVYEHASNGSLSDWIHAKSSLLSLIQRLQIALDVATGLNYLHNFADPPYVHRDLTSGNIFLDVEFRGKIGNLGLARSTERDGDYVLTKHVEGTRGYLAPEYLEHGLVSTKLDVYAFGVVVLEIVTGKEASELKKEIDEGSAVEELLVGGSFLPEGLVSFVVRLVVDCLKRDHLNRPTMDEIVLSLSKILTASKSWDSSY